jgi:hypothetical protein
MSRNSVIMDINSAIPGMLEIPGIELNDPRLPPPLVTRLVSPPGMRAPNASMIGQNVSVKVGDTKKG